MLQIYNTLTRQKSAFTPIEPKKIKMYVCGMTVYDYCHLGHARVMVAFDVVAKFLRNEGYLLTYVRNITDIDDKILNRAAEQQIPFTDLTEKFINAMYEDEASLGVARPDVEPRATGYIDQIIALIARLIEKGFAYHVDGGDVYYDVSRFPEYGKLSQKDLAGLQAGIRIDVDKAKRGANDFVLWKMAKPDEPSWESPWGLGRPGWHIECSAMATDCLGNHFDIHGGGLDLQFPHHENEIAQSEGATGETFVNTWMHVGFLQINAEKMSKSLGNFFTIREVLKQYAPEVIRYFLISSHYRSPLNYSQDNLETSRATITKVYTALRSLTGEVAVELDESIAATYRNRFRAAMCDDFNTPEALAVLFDIISVINQAHTNMNKAEAKSYAKLLIELAKPLGIFQQDPSAFLQAGVLVDEEKINKLIQDRNDARREKQFTKADDVRDQLNQMGIELEDTAEGTVWRKRSN